MPVPQLPVTDHDGTTHTACALFATRSNASPSTVPIGSKGPTDPDVVPVTLHWGLLPAIEEGEGQ
jgi:hypothetical protein